MEDNERPQMLLRQACNQGLSHCHEHHTASCGDYGQVGLKPQVSQNEYDDYYEVTIRLPK